MKGIDVLYEQPWMITGKDGRFWAAHEMAVSALSWRIFETVDVLLNVRLIYFRDVFMKHHDDEFSIREVLSNIFELREEQYIPTIVHCNL